MVKIRLRRVGKKKQPMYKIVVADSRAARNGKFIESLGLYNPLVRPMSIELTEARLYHWLKRGAQPTDTTRSLLQRKGYWLKWSLMKKGKDEATVTAEYDKWLVLQVDKVQREDAKKARRKAARKRASTAASAPAVVAEAVPAAEATPAA